ncbi:gluconokinase [Virgisporangium aliadipatigenens]|uniref:Gluconokinase n=1 Tax=Virgisporangium aliadipatigenens TaxID=741659 RepID=A0A8J3YGS4_9ACTN|nr:gluconokinase [Virgisporangium aliadipatigenens]
MVVMGVAGSGKTTIGRLLAERLGVPYAEADDFHPAANVDKMTAGVPLDDADRAPWLDAIAEWIGGQRDKGGVVTCSALRHPYRERLRRADADLWFLHLDVPKDVIAERMAKREGHFMPPSLIDSQFAALEPLHEGEAGAKVDATRAPERIVEDVLRAYPTP